LLLPVFEEAVVAFCVEQLGQAPIHCVGDWIISIIMLIAVLCSKFLMGKDFITS
jgi:hypothetical protein